MTVTPSNTPFTAVALHLQPPLALNYYDKFDWDFKHFSA